MTGSILILAPRGRDAGVIEQVLTRAGMECRICADLAQVMDGLEGEAGALLVTEESLAGAVLPRLFGWIAAQPPWSDIPVIVLASKQAGPRADQPAQRLARLGNVVLLERPINAETLTSAAFSAHRARLRQYQAREVLLDQKRVAAELRQLNETLEQRVEERASELDRTRQTLAFALDAAGMGSWDLDLVGDIATRSPQHDRIFGYGDALAVWNRETFLDHVVGDDRDAAAQAFAQAADRGSLDLECRVNRADGATRWITARGRVSYDEAGRPIRMAGVVMDTTERRQTEDALHQAQKMEAIGQLTGGVAHDFNNLLTVIVGGLDMMIRRPEQTDRVLRLANAAMSAARRGEQLTQQLLAFSRRQMLRPETLDPNRLLRGFEALAQRAVGESVTLKLDLAPDVAPIRIDAAQFESAVLNLIVNARDAMQAGGTITLRSRNVRRGAPVPPDDGPAGPYVEISVSDTGTGIDGQTLARAFEPFFTTKEVGKGSGLGLSQVYGFVRSAGGTVEIDSAVGAGTTVMLSFPGSAEAAVDERPAGQGATALRPAAHGETILLVEDDEQVRGMAVDSLRDLGYTVMVACNAREALVHLGGAGRIDIMFSDVLMPGGMNGAELAARAGRLRPAMKILLTSGYVGGPAAGAGGQGAARHGTGPGHGGGPETPAVGPVIGRDVPMLAKPYRRDELAQKLRLVLTGA
jgi:PAS domain S-box-containing protein